MEPSTGVSAAWRYASLGLWLTMAVGGACAGPGETVGGPTTPSCNARVIVGFVAPADASTVSDIGREHGLELAIVATLQPDLLVLDLVATEAEPGCDTALAALRGDARVRSADLDARRRPQAR